MEDRENVFFVQKKRKPFGWKKGLLIFVIAIIVIVGIALLIWIKGDKDKEIDSKSDYIGEIYVEGEISETSDSGLLSNSSYNHQWTLDRIEEMKEDKNNKGIILYVDSPGGSVYASDELYLAIKDYKKETKRPVYSYMASMAASGGYYISAPCDKIYANRNCWTGSIGVTMGTMWDFTGLMEKYGVKAQNVTAGRNKAMGSSVSKMTKEQKEIFQSLVEEAYDQFVGIVAEGRNMKTNKVKKLADGRIYTALQAKKNGLIDKVATHEQVFEDMKQKYKLRDDVELLPIEEDEEGLFSSLSKYATKIKKITSIGEFSEVSQVKSLIKENQTFTISYMSEIRK